MERIRAVLNPGGVAYLTFDGLEEGARKPHVALPDGTWRYVGGKWDGMLWRPYTDEEILDLCRGLTVLEFATRPNGSRVMWARKKVVDTTSAG